MLRLSYPPLVILLDLLFLFLFISIINSDKTASIEFSDNELPTDIALVYKINGEYQSTGRVPDGFPMIWKCPQLKECVEAKRKYQTDDVNVLFPVNVETEIAKISASAMSSKYCNKLNFTFYSDHNGKTVLDYEVLSRENSCLDRIPGFDIWLKSRL